MVLWRISNHATLDGEGGIRVAGRWHSKGRRIVYLASNPGSALLEYLVHLEVPVELIPDTFQLVKVVTSEGVSRDRICLDDLPCGWTGNTSRTQSLGNRWLREARTALLEVPSALAPETCNWLLNPEHPEAGACRIEWSRPYPFDSRLRSSP